MCFCEKDIKLSVLNIVRVSFKPKASQTITSLSPSEKKKKKKKSTYPICFSNFKVKNLKCFLLPYLHAKAKAHPIRLEGIIYSVQSQGLL